MTIDMDKDMAAGFYDVISSELRCLINEYDPDTARVPGKTRMAAKEMLCDILDKWDLTQPHVSGMAFVDLSNTKACSIELTTKEAKLCKKLSGKAVKDLNAFITQCSGQLAVHIQSKINVINRIISNL